MLARHRILTGSDILDLDTGYNVKSAVEKCLDAIKMDESHLVNEEFLLGCDYGFLAATLVKVQKFIEFCGDDKFYQFCEHVVSEREKRCE